MSRAHHISDEVSMGDPLRRFLITTMAVYYKAIGATHLRARAAPFDPPICISGQKNDHRPDITCAGPDKKRTGILCAMVMPVDVQDEEVLHDRLLLFWGAVYHNPTPAELHIAVQNVKLKNGLTLGRHMREKCAKWGIVVKSFHEV